MNKLRKGGAHGLAAWLVSGLWLMLGSAQAATFVVTKQADTADGACNSDCSLREAIQAANESPGADTILLRAGYYKLTQAPAATGDTPATGDLDIAGDGLVIKGLADGGSAIDAAGLDRVIEVLPGATVELRDLSLRNGVAAGQGGGVLNAGNLTLRRVSVAHNAVHAKNAVLEGGGIYNGGVLRIVQGTIDQNQALESLTGGRGAGIFNAAGAQLYVYDSNLRDNTDGIDDATGYGAALYNLGQARVERCLFARNDAGDGEGSAIANRDRGSLAVFASTFSDNGHDGARGTIANGGARDPQTTPRTVLGNITVANNNGGGVLSSGALVLRNSVLAANYSQDGNDRYFDSANNCRLLPGSTISQTGSLIGADGSTCPALTFVDNRRVFSEVLTRLSYSGGPTAVFLPLPASPVIDAADDAVCGSADQRQFPRPADGNNDGVAHCDIGAAELQPDD